MVTVEQIAEVIWNTSRRDEGTISATGAKIVAKDVYALMIAQEPKARQRLKIELAAMTDERDYYRDRAHRSEKKMTIVEQSRDEAIKQISSLLDQISDLRSLVGLD